MNYFIQVILPIPIGKLFSYRVNQQEAHFLKEGIPVVVPFGKSKLYLALVHSVYQSENQGDNLKDIISILDEKPLLTSSQLELWQWIANYYMCTLGEVARVALPGVFLLESETVIRKSLKEIDETTLSDEEYLIYESLNYKSEISIKEASKIVDKKNVIPVLRQLLLKDAVELSEQIKEKYTPKKISYFRLHSLWKEKNSTKELFELLKNAPKQKLFLLKYFADIAQSKKQMLELKPFLTQHEFSNNIYKELIHKGIIEEIQQKTDRISFESENQLIKQLTPVQQKALQEVQTQFEEHTTVVLHGVIASGKTEIYIQLIDKALSEGKQVLYLLPDIASSSQVLQRLTAYFSQYISVYHSKYSSSERAEVWYNLLEKKQKAQLIIGVHGGVLLPFSNLGLIIVDQEHESAYKQSISSPRFHTRDTALMLAKLHQAKVILGSATPSVETYNNIQNGKYGYVYLGERYAQNLAPEIQLIDIKDRKRKKLMKGYFSQELIDAISEVLQHKEQVILFQNRRGYSPVVECNVCGNSPQCPNCDVTLTYHQYNNQLKCHYCGYTMAKPLTCPQCASTDLNTKGVGTEQIEYIVKSYFPQAKVGRMDKETTRSKHGYQKILSQFENREIDILVGTQMLVKGLSFSNVQLLGVVHTDSVLHFPEFRVQERAFQLLTQAAGRAGRINQQGKAIFQTYQPENKILNQIKEENYQAMVLQQLQERKTHDFPPFVRLIKITFKHRNFQTINTATHWFSERLKECLSEGVQILGPEFPVVSRIKNEYVKNILLKINLQLSLKREKNAILRVGTSFLSIAEFRSVRVFYDVDPEG